MSMWSEQLSCDEAEHAILWALDGELEAEQMVELETHLAECSPCRRVMQNEGRLREALSRASNAMAAPVSLRRHLAQAVEAETGRNRVFGGSWAPAMAAAAILLSFAFRGGNDGAIKADLLQAATYHSRDLPMDVEAAEVTDVQQYLSRKLPFPVKVKDVPRYVEPNFTMPTLGGRVTSFKDRDAAYVRYETEHGRVSMFVYEDQGDELGEMAPRVNGRSVFIKTVRGLPTARWREHGLVYSVVADMPERELRRMLKARLIR